MDFDWVGIERLSISTELKRAGYRRPSGADVKQISELGPLIPCIVQSDLMPGYFQILANAYVWLAVQQAGLYEVPISIVKPVDDSERDLIIRSDIGESPIERAGRYKSWLLENPDKNINELAEIENCTRSSIAHTIRLLKLEPSIALLISNNELTAGHGKELLKVLDSSDRLTFAKKAAEKKWSVRELKNAIDPKTDQALSGAVKDPDIIREENLLTETIGSPVTIDFDNGFLKIDYRGELSIYDGIKKRLLSNS